MKIVMTFMTSSGKCTSLTNATPCEQVPMCLSAYNDAINRLEKMWDMTTEEVADVIADVIKNQWRSERMNRQILFKAKRLDNGEWVEGYYCKTTIGNDVRPSDVIFVPFKVSRNEEWGWMKVDPNTLCQYTGLTDKNGNKIWENDIVKKIDCNALGWHRERICRVLLDNYGFWLLTTYGDGYSLCEFNDEQLEVLGNIFDNAYLLEVE